MVSYKMGIKIEGALTMMIEIAMLYDCCVVYN